MPTEKAKNQRTKVLNYLREHKRATTLEIRKAVGAMAPAARILELRAEGHNIMTAWRWQDDEQGRPHKQGLYVLLNSQEASE